MSKKVVIISPNPQSLYTTSVCELLLRSNIEISAILVKKFTFKRFRDEFSRDGFRLIKKIWKKLILKNSAYAEDESENIINFRKKNNINLITVDELKKTGTAIHYLNDINSIKSENILIEINPDLVVFTGGGLIRNNILINSGRGVLNCHMGILPMYRGMDVVEWPLLFNDFDNVGLTIHLMSKGVDEGAILKILKIPLRKNDSIKKLRTRFEPLMAINMAKVVVNYLDDEITPIPQNLNDGKQFFIMHNSLIKIAESNLKNHTKKF